MKLNINAPSINWEEAAVIAREYEFQGVIPEGKDKAIQVIRKFEYKLWKTAKTVNIELVS